MWNACSPAGSPLIETLSRTPPGVCTRSTSPTALPLASLSGALASSAEAGNDNTAANAAAAPNVAKCFVAKRLNALMIGLLVVLLDALPSPRTTVQRRPKFRLIWARAHVLHQLLRIGRQRLEV